jgi:hypothetical protein
MKLTNTQKKRLVTLLESGPQQMIFRYANSRTTRHIVATLHDDLIDTKKPDTVINGNLISVWDFEKQDWRWFYMDRIISINGKSITNALR